MIHKNFDVGESKSTLLCLAPCSLYFVNRDFYKLTSTNTEHIIFHCEEKSFILYSRYSLSFSYRCIVLGSCWNFSSSRTVFLAWPWQLLLAAQAGKRSSSQFYAFPHKLRNAIGNTRLRET